MEQESAIQILKNDIELNGQLLGVFEKEDSNKVVKLKLDESRTKASLEQCNQLLEEKNSSLLVQLADLKQELKLKNEEITELKKEKEILKAKFQKTTRLMTEVRDMVLKVSSDQASRCKDLEQIVKAFTTHLSEIERKTKQNVHRAASNEYADLHKPDKIKESEKSSEPTEGSKNASEADNIGTKKRYLMLRLEKWMEMESFLEKFDHSHDCKDLLILMNRQANSKLDKQTFSELLKLCEFWKTICPNRQIHCLLDPNIVPTLSRSSSRRLFDKFFNLLTTSPEIQNGEDDETAIRRVWPQYADDILSN